MIFNNVHCLVYDTFIINLLQENLEIAKCWQTTLFIFRSMFPVRNQSLRGNSDKYFTSFFVKSNTHLRVCPSKHDRHCQHCILYVNCKYILSHTILVQYYQKLDVKICDKEILSYIIPHRYSSPVTGLEWPRGFQEVKVPRFHDNSTGWW
jgi:hypothetical protein